MVFHFRQNEDGTYSYEGAARSARSIKSPFLRVLINLLITLAVGALIFYVKLPAINLQSGEFYAFLIFLCAVYVVLSLITGGFRPAGSENVLVYARKNAAVPFYIILALLAICIVGAVSGMQIFRAKAYSQLLPLGTGDFSQEVAEISFDQIPMLDSNSANTLADRKLGELSELVSQFTVNDSSAQINYNNHPVRVSYLDYGDFIKWINNRSSGIPAYMIIDMVSQEVTVQRVSEGIKYSPSEYFGRDITRYLRFNYPTYIFESVNFEIDEEGTPYWIAPVYKKTIGLFSGRDVKGAVLVNAVTGDHQYYGVDSIPTWVDRVYMADLIIEQYDFYGRFHNGFINSIFGQRDCTETTDGYNYIAKEDDVWLYTGVTSVSSDRGNIGFILVNQRTKQARYYSCAGAEEYSAMSSAQGAVQQYSYKSTFPLLLNLSGQPTYFMALKDASNLVKMYAMVNVEQYQIVSTGYTVSECIAAYENMLIQRGIVSADDVAEIPTDTAGLTEIEGVIANIRSAVIDGNTVYFINLISDTNYYTLKAADDPRAVILDIGDSVTLLYNEAELTDGIAPASLAD